MAHGNPVTLGANVSTQGELAVGNATVQLTATKTPCSRIWFGAPTAGHTKAGANTARVLVGTGSTGALNKSGGIPLEVDNLVGFFYPIDDASKVFLTGTQAGDVVEFQIFN